MNVLADSVQYSTWALCDNSKLSWNQVTLPVAETETITQPHLFSTPAKQMNMGKKNLSFWL